MDPTLASQFAVMLASGMPPSDIIPYFLPTESDEERAFTLKKWLHSRELNRAVKALQGKGWEQMSVEERMRYAVDKHYSEMAYFLYRHNYAELSGPDKQKADTCRAAIEARLAGMAGKVDTLTQFFDDLRSGKLRVGQPVNKSTHFGLETRLSPD